ncbi:TPA: hypothetical protein RTG57_001730 [Campylobacter jejuni]|nr:hypothetical protein [Campylobacter jejuni]HDZ5057802.1 hypothetical protein [Campylobacter jejuni]
MSYKIKVTNILNSPIKAFYRMPKEKTEKSFNPMVEIYIQPRALMNEVIFPSEAHFIEWKNQNKSLLDREYLILDEKINEKKIEGKVKDVASKDNSIAKQKTNKIVEDLQETADNINAKIEFKEEPAGKVQKNKK